jgi:hypothetical protein
MPQPFDSTLFVFADRVSYVRRWRVAVLELQTFICDVIQGFRILPIPSVFVEREFHGVSIPKVRRNSDSDIKSNTDCSSGRLLENLSEAVKFRLCWKPYRDALGDCNPKA